MTILDLTVIIPTLNRPKMLEKTIRNFLNKEFLPCEIIIIDQSDKEFSLVNQQTIKNLKSELIIYKHVDFKSLTKARNFGLKICKSNYVVMSDDDVFLHNEGFQIISNQFRNKYGLIGAFNNKENTNKSNFFGYIFGFKNFFKRKRGYVTKSILGRYPLIKKTCKSEWAMGFFFAFRKDLALEKKIAFDEQLTSYAYPEDLDFTYRYYKSIKNEYLSGFVSSIIVDHLASQEYRIPSRKAVFMYVLNRKYLSIKFNFGFSSKLWQFVTNHCLLLQNRKNKTLCKDYKDAIIASKKINKKCLNSYAEIFERLLNATK